MLSLLDGSYVGYRSACGTRLTVCGSSSSTITPRPRLANAKSITLADAAKAKDDGRLPMNDHNTRIFVIGDTGTQARAVAEAIVHDAFHNVSFFDGGVSDVPELVTRDP
jgi:rhodanese-related sulfurtransferase